MWKKLNYSKIVARQRGIKIIVLFTSADVKLGKNIKYESQKY